MRVPFVSSSILLIVVLLLSFGAECAAATSVAFGTQSGKIDGNLEVTGDSVLNGMVTGDIVVRRGSAFQLNGMCGGNLLVESGARAIIRGSVRGDVVNHGIVDHFGIIQGVVTNDGTFLRRSQSLVHGDVKP